MQDREVAFYAQFFVENPTWNTPYPNIDEATRAGKILPIVSTIRRDTPGAPFRILEVGCGRGWLSHLLSVYGEVTGIDPVGPVIEYARQLFPGPTFLAATPEAFAETSPGAFDVIVATEVIEHVPTDQQQRFLLTLRSLLKPGGGIILTTPRGELFDAWAKGRDRTQPLEEWLTAAELEALVTRCDLRIRAWEWSTGTSTYPNAWTRRVRALLNRALPRLGVRAIDLRLEPLYQVVWLTLKS